MFTKRLTMWCFINVLGTLLLATTCMKSVKAVHESACFCQLHGQINDCECTVESVDSFNNEKVFSNVQTLLKKSFFRFFRYNPKRKCEFWDMSSVQCTSEGCQVEECKDDDVPAGLTCDRSTCPNVMDITSIYKYPNDARCNLQTTNMIDNTQSMDMVTTLSEWTAFDKSNSFCQLDDSYHCTDCTFVDLSLNPERYTGYKGEVANRVWKAIYEENCFQPPVPNMLHVEQTFFNEHVEKMCLEKRTFFRAVSGLHTSITIHLCSVYFLETKSNPFSAPKVSWGRNVEEFRRRFDPVLTGGQSTFRLKNLYFVYLLELKALVKAASYLKNYSFFTGNKKDDEDTSLLVKNLMDTLETFPSSSSNFFDESKLFKGDDNLKSQFQSHFYNISKIMDCVSCDKCKLWGKLQITGLGTALKILFADYVDLTRNEIVSLLNAFGRISTSIHQLDWFRRNV